MYRLGVMTLFYDHFQIPLSKGKTIKTLFPLSKTVYVPCIHVGWASLVIGRPLTPMMCFFMWAHYALLNIFNDIKDIRVDIENRVITLPTIIGDENTLRFITMTYMWLASMSVLCEQITLCIAFVLLSGYTILSRKYALPSAAFYMTHLSALYVSSCVLRAID